MFGLLKVSSTVLPSYYMIVPLEILKPHARIYKNSICDNLRIKYTGHDVKDVKDIFNQIKYINSSGLYRDWKRLPKKKLEWIKIFYDIKMSTWAAPEDDASSASG